MDEFCEMREINGWKRGLISYKICTDMIYRCEKQFINQNESDHNHKWNDKIKIFLSVRVKMVNDRNKWKHLKCKFDFISKAKSLVFLRERLCQWCFATPGLGHGEETDLKVQKNEHHNSAQPNFKHAAWQSVWALCSDAFASLNTFRLETWESFPSIASKQLSVHHFNRSEVSTCGSSQKNDMLACRGILGFQLAGVHSCNRPPIELCSCDFMTRHVPLWENNRVSVYFTETCVCVSTHECVCVSVQFVLLTDQN